MPTAQAPSGRIAARTAVNVPVKARPVAPLPDPTRQEIERLLLRAEAGNVEDLAVSMASTRILNERDTLETLLAAAERAGQTACAISALARFLPASQDVDIEAGLWTVPHPAQAPTLLWRAATAAGHLPEDLVDHTEYLAEAAPHKVSRALAEASTERLEGLVAEDRLAASRREHRSLCEAAGDYRAGRISLPRGMRWSDNVIGRLATNPTISDLWLHHLLEQADQSSVQRAACLAARHGGKAGLARLLGCAPELYDVDILADHILYTHGPELFAGVCAAVREGTRSGICPESRLGQMLSAVSGSALLERSFWAAQPASELASGTLQRRFRQLLRTQGRETQQVSLHLAEDWQGSAQELIDAAGAAVGEAVGGA